MLVYKSIIFQDYIKVVEMESQNWKSAAMSFTRVCMHGRMCYTCDLVVEQIALHFCSPGLRYNVSAAECLLWIFCSQNEHLGLCCSTPLWYFFILPDSKTFTWI